MDDKKTEETNIDKVEVDLTHLTKIEAGLRARGYLSVADLKSAIKRCYKHAKSPDIPVAVIANGQMLMMFRIKSIVILDRPEDKSEVLVIDVEIPVAEEHKEPKIEVVKQMPETPASGTA